jgi:nitrite reductase/ring-hydroxylating ferredoxin subunit
MNSNNYLRVAAIADVPEGKMIEVALSGKSLVLCHTKDGWYALDNVCSHAYAKMHEGRLRGVRLICPLHGASFDCRTGAVLGAPALYPLKTYPVRVSGDDVEIAMDAQQ